MIGMLTGKIVYSGKNPLIISVGGVGFEVYIPSITLGKIKTGTMVTLHTYTHVRDDGIELFGFLDRNDLDLFRLLITVSGIGPKTALLISDRGAEAVKNAIIKSDVDFFTTIPRLGRKNAQKIIIELKNKLGSISDLDLTGEESGETAELVDALIGMGFSRNDVIGTIRKITFTNKPLEEKIRQALKYLGKNK
jgi:Holliday junction DNA helicase RuvA